MFVRMSWMGNENNKNGVYIIIHFYGRFTLTFFLYFTLTNNKNICSCASEKSKSSKLNVNSSWESKKKMKKEKVLLSPLKFHFSLARKKQPFGMVCDKFSICVAFELLFVSQLIVRQELYLKRKTVIPSKRDNVQTVLYYVCAKISFSHTVNFYFALVVPYADPTPSIYNCLQIHLSHSICDAECWNVFYRFYRIYFRSHQLQQFFACKANKKTGMQTNSEKVSSGCQAIGTINNKANICLLEKQNKNKMKYLYPIPSGNVNENEKKELLFLEPLHNHILHCEKW